MNFFSNHSHNNPQLSPDTGGALGGSPSLPRLEYNPLGVAVHDQLECRDLDLTGLVFDIHQIASTAITHEGQRYLTADYDLGAVSTSSTHHLADPDGRIRLRLRGIETTEHGFEAVAFQAQRLDSGADLMFDDLTHSAGPHSLRDSAGRFQHGFTRIDDMEGAYHGIRTTVGDPTRPGEESTAVQLHQIMSLDFMRTTRTSGGEEYEQWALVEFNQRTSDMVTLLGWSLDPHCIVVERH